MVVAFHAIDLSGASATIHRVFAYGWMGVDLFFVLSGFLIGRQAFKPRVETPARFLEAFWTKRWLRTLPLYYVVLFTCAVIKPALFHVPFKGDIWHFATFTQNYMAPRDFVASWSLCVEEQFYLVLPLFVVAMSPRALPPMGMAGPTRGERRDTRLDLANDVGCRTGRRSLRRPDPLADPHPPGWAFGRPVPGRHRTGVARLAREAQAASRRGWSAPVARDLRRCSDRIVAAAPGVPCSSSR